MKQPLIIIIALMLSIVNISCKKASTVMLDERVDSVAILKTQGMFAGLGREKVSGSAKIYLQKDRYYLALENFYTTNGPDLKVYLSKEDKPIDFIKLSDLKSTNGNQVYDITGMPDFAKYKYVLIHCEKYNHLFGKAELK